MIQEACLQHNSMEEFLIPEDSRSEHSFSPIGSKKTRLDSVKNLLRYAFTIYIRDYVKTKWAADSAKIYLSFPGELLMRMLKMLILPLITSSLMSGLSSMESKACCHMGLLTVTYYLWTTFIAVVVGIVLVVIIKPGFATDMESTRLGGGPVITSADALLDLVRNMIPSNLIEATFQQYKTDLIPLLKTQDSIKQHNLVYLMPDDDHPDGHQVFLDLTPPPDIHYKAYPGSSHQMNVLGIVIFSATMGLLLGKMGERGAPLVNVCQCINECVMKIINAAVWYFPFGIVFLVAAKILDMSDPSTLGKKLGWYAVTVLTGLFVHGFVLLPLFYFLLTRKNPFSFIRGLLQAMVIALATSSSSATLPITMKCLLENCHVERQIARFVLPVGATINMDGTALYEAVAAIFIAQVNEYELDFGQMVTIRHFLQLFRRDPEAFPGQPRDIVSPGCPGSSPGPLPGGACPEHLSRETSRRHPKQMPEPPQLPPFNVEEQRLYSELLPGDRAPYPISKGAHRHPTEEAHFGHLYPGSYPFGHDPELMTIDFPWEAEECDPPIVGTHPPVPLLKKRDHHPGLTILTILSCLRSPPSQPGSIGLLLQLDGIPYFQCPPLCSGIAAAIGSRDLMATAPDGCINNGGGEHGPLRLDVPNLPRDLVETLPEVGVEDSTNRGISKMFPTDPLIHLGLPSLSGILLRKRIQLTTSTEVQQENTIRVQIRGAVPPNHAPPGITVIAHMGVEVPQQNYGVPSRSTFQHPSQGLQEGWVLHTAVRPISRNNSETPIPGPKAQGNNPLIYRGKLQHMAAELGGYKEAHPSPTPLTMGHSREEEGPTFLKEDRFRTMINVLGDSLAAGIIGHLCRKNFADKR
ncbi:hypothetical protein QTP86_033325, partial [Hemibagrus guttatus]